MKTVKVERAYTVVPTMARFTGGWGLTRACEWAKKVQAGNPDVDVRIFNEFGTDLGSTSQTPDIINVDGSMYFAGCCIETHAT